MDCKVLMTASLSLFVVAKIVPCRNFAYGVHALYSRPGWGKRYSGDGCFWRAVVRTAIDATKDSCLSLVAARLGIQTTRELIRGRAISSTALPTPILNVNGLRPSLAYFK